jgi:glycosyltransferase involved in cell wall biosynthesis
MKITNKNMNKINMLLVLSNFFEEERPTWPEVIGIYGINFHDKRHNIHWIMPYKTGFFNKIKVVYFKNVKIYLIPFTRSNNIILKALSTILYQVRLLIFLFISLSKRKYNLIQVRDDALAGLSAIFLKSLFRVKTTFNYSFPFYQADNESYKIGSTGLLSLLYRKIMKIILVGIVLKYSDFIFPISKEMIEELSEEGIDREKMFPISLGIDFSIFQVDTDKTSDLMKKLSINRNDFVYIYVGVIVKMRGLDTVLKAFGRLQKNHKKAKLLFVGDGDALKDLKRISKDLDLEENVIFTGRISYWDIPNHIDLADVGLSLIFPRKCYYVSSPNKLFEYMALRKPVIANREIPEHERVIKSSNGGVLTEFKEDEISKAMSYAIEHGEKVKDMGEKGYEWVKENRTFKQMSERLKSIYDTIL